MRALMLALLLAGCAAPAATNQTLGGSSWQLVRFQGADDKVITPDERAKYTLAFAPDGIVNVRFDCNRGRGGWKSAGKNQLEFGPMALTRAMCPPGSLHDQLVRHWPFIRSYTIKDGRLFLALMADGGTYEFTALPAP
ncbi:MAG TPA: META domain-containing protein [Burkholderiales bacterium]|nr:META domain-containing protein [Burkholderiales bacterium]